MRNRKSSTSSIGEEQIREAFEYAASGMAVADLDLHLSGSNSAYREIVGRTQQELDSETILSITHPEDREDCQQHLNWLVSGKINSFVLEKRYVRPDETAVWVRNSFSLLKDERGDPSHIILICNDITERRRAERLLVESEKLAIVGQLAASIAHEINNPLEGALNLIYLVRTAETLEDARSLAAQAEEEIQRAAQIATHTLHFHKQQTKPASTNIASLVQSVLAIFKGKLHMCGIEVEFKQSDDPELICYSGEIRQVLANLVRNAIEAMPNGGVLRIRVKPVTDWRTGVPGVRITVADTGSGMSRDTRRRIYDPFFTTKGTLGTGLGLWVSAGILTKHQGSMHVRSSVLPGASGTAFTLIFPRSGAEGKLSDSAKSRDMDLEVELRNPRTSSASGIG
jgi:PAS domain S-box-containing protein